MKYVPKMQKNGIYKYIYVMNLNIPLISLNYIHDRIEKVYNDYSSLEPTETNSVNKATTSMMINMKTLTDTSNSKIAELLLQGTNMGIIEGRKLLNHKDELDSEVYKILTDFIEMQEDSVETLKKYL